jgi:hypothetical protein
MALAKSMAKSVEEKAQANPSSTKGTNLAMQRRREELEAKRKKEEEKKKEDENRSKKQNRVHIYFLKLIVEKRCPSSFAGPYKR